MIKKKYSILYADAPWDFNNKNTGGSQQYFIKSLLYQNLIK